MRGHFVVFGLLLGFSAHPLMAASDLAYTVKIIRSGRDAEMKTFTVVRSGDRAHASLIDGPEGEGIAYDRLLLLDPAHLIAINSRNRTWYELETQGPFALQSRYLAPALKPRVKNVRVRLDPPSPSTTDPHHQYHAGEISYDLYEGMGGHPVKISCVARFQVTTSDVPDRSTWIGRMLPETGYGPVDAEMRSVESQIGGFPIRLSLDAERRYEGGPAMHDVMRVDVTDLHETQAADADFVRPSDYLQQKPVILAPGGGPDGAD